LSRGGDSPAERPRETWLEFAAVVCALPRMAGGAVPVYRRSVPVTTNSTRRLPQPEADKASVPVRNGHLGAVTLGHFGGVGFDLVAALPAPYNQPDLSCRGVPERHPWRAI
jgi:hypothetical protein